MYKSLLPLIFSFPTILILATTIKTIESISLRVFFDPLQLLKAKNLIRICLNYYFLYGIVFITIKYYLLRKRSVISIFLFIFGLIFRFVNCNLILATIFFISEFTYPIFPKIKNGLITIIFDKDNYSRVYKQLFRNFMFLFMISPFLVFFGIKIQIKAIYSFLILHIYSELLKNIIFYNTKFVICNLIDYTNCKNLLNPLSRFKENDINIFQDIIFDNRYCYEDNFFNFTKKIEYLPLIREFVYLKMPISDFFEAEVSYLNHIIDLTMNIEKYYNETLYYDYLVHSNEKSSYIVKRVKSLRIFDIFFRRIIRDLYKRRYSIEINRSILCLEILGIEKDFSKEILKVENLEKKLSCNLGSENLMRLSKKI
ncbi:hypothetical protein DMUE_5474 [Dictyocoela muelleri]|nr:hypothetical protein DMUE_5474 [Dictyocoela muelleri]